MQVIVFDGVCNLCNGFVDFVIAHDNGTFEFAALQTPIGQSLVPNGAGETIYLVTDIDGVKSVYDRSTAALKVAQKLRFPWFLISAFLIIPKVFRDPIYNWVARHRYKWFGRRETCRLPTPSEKARFL